MPTPKDRMKTGTDLPGVDPQNIWGFTMVLEKPVRNFEKRRYMKGVSIREGWSGRFGELYHWLGASSVEARHT